MYEDKRETFSIKDIFLQLLFIVLLVFILIWLFPTKGYLERKLDGIESGLSEKLQPLYTRLFTDNILTMKDAAKSYFTTPRLPQNVGDTVTMTLSEMYEKNLLLELVDSNNNACDPTKSYVQLTKMDDEYELKVNLSCSDKEAFIIEHLGCYDYCDGLLCTKEESNKAKEKATVSTPKRYRYQYVLTTGGSCGGYGSWSEWTNNKIEENSNTKVQTKTEKVLDHYEQVYKVVDTKYNNVDYYEDVNYGYSTRTVKTTTTYNYTTKTTTTMLSYATETYKVTDTYDYIYTRTATGSHWVSAGTTSSNVPLASTDTVKYTQTGRDTSLACEPNCTSVTKYYYNVEKLQTDYVTTKSCPNGTTDTGSGCVAVNTKTKQYCPQGEAVEGGCRVVNTEKYCAQGTDTGSGCAVVSYSKQNYCAAGGTDTGSGCVIKVKKTKQVAQLIYGYVDGDPVYKDVVYYRSATRTCKDATVDYKWSESNNDASLKAQGYTLTGLTEEIK